MGTSSGSWYASSDSQPQEVGPCASQLCSFRTTVNTRISSALHAVHCELQLLRTVYIHSPTFPHYQIAPLICRHMCPATVTMNIHTLNYVHAHTSCMYSQTPVPMVTNLTPRPCAPVVVCVYHRQAMEQYVYYTPSSLGPLIWRHLSFVHPLNSSHRKAGTFPCE